MATARPFSYNLGAGITGTTQVGDLAVGTPTNGFPASPRFWNGPDEELGYVIAHPVPAGNQPTPVSGVNAFLGFNRTPDFTDSSFISLSNYVARLYGGTSANFSSALQASTWLTANGFWNSYIAPVLSLDASTYSGSGTTWTDSVGGKNFTLYNSPTWSSSNGGYFTFSRSSSQYAECSTSLSSLGIWSVSVWHYYTGDIGTNESPCLVTEVYPGSTSSINYNLGNGSDSSPWLQNGFFKAGWWNTPSGVYQLTSNNWYYIVGTYDGSTVSLYVNGSLIVSASHTDSPTSSGGGIRLMRRWDVDQYWGGRLATVDIYDKSLDPTQISAIWNSTKSRFGL
jgi:hypothetical protein